MHGPLPPDVTLGAPYWWQPGMPLLPPADHRAPVPLKRKRVTSAEPKTDPAKRAYMRVPDTAKLWFQDFHAYQARVWQVTRIHYSPGEAFGTGAFRARGTRHIHGGARDLGGRPPSTSISSRARNGRGSSYAACSSHGYSRRLTPATGRARLTLPESVNFCSCASSTCTIAPKSHRIASGTWTRRLCAWFHQASVGGPKKAETAYVFASRAFVTVTLAANMRCGRHVDADSP